jgi:hypothetical protein
MNMACIHNGYELSLLPTAPFLQRHGGSCMISNGSMWPRVLDNPTATRDI